MLVYIDFEILLLTLTLPKLILTGNVCLFNKVQCQKTMLKKLKPVRILFYIWYVQYLVEIDFSTSWHGFELHTVTFLDAQIVVCI